MTEKDPKSPDCEILYIFFAEKQEYFLLLGREEKKAESENQSSEESFLESEDSKDEQDDDSPYFVKITLDQMFLTHLEEPNIMEGKEIEQNFDLLLANKVFK